MFDRQLSDLSVELFDLGLAVFDLLCLVGEHARQAVNRLPFPCRHLRWVDFGLGRNILRRLVVISPFLTGCICRTYAAIFSFMAGVMPPMPMLGRSLL